MKAIYWLVKKNDVSFNKPIKDTKSESGCKKKFNLNTF